MYVMKSYRYIYEIKCLCDEYNGYVYIGQHTTKNMNDVYAGSGVKLNEYYRNYGKTENKTYEKNILRYADTQKQLDAYEIYYIRKYKNKYGSKCLNIDDGGLHHEDNREAHIFIMPDKCITTEELVSKLGLDHSKQKNINTSELFDWFKPYDINFVLNKLNI